jgi:hypothetical protein
MIIPIPPSGDYSGRTDANAIQSTIDSVQKATPAYSGAGVVELSRGRYWLNRTLALKGGKCVLRGAGCASIGWNPNAPQDIPMISVEGAPYGAVPVLSNLALWCSNRARGVTCKNISTQCSLDSVYVRESVGCALELSDCWWLNLRNVSVLYFADMALSTRDANGCHVDSLACIRGTSSQSPLIDFHGGGSVFTNLCVEDCKYGEQPLIRLPVGSIGNLFSSTRLEGNHTTRNMVLCENGRYNRFDHVFVVNANNADPQSAECDCFMRCTGTTRGNSVNRLVGWSGIRKGGNIVLLDGGKHIGTSVTECATNHTKVPRERWIGEINNPTVQAEWDDQFDSVN